SPLFSSWDRGCLDRRAFIARPSTPRLFKAQLDVVRMDDLSRFPHTPPGGINAALINVAPDVDSIGQFQGFRPFIRNETSPPPGQPPPPSRPVAPSAS